MKKYTMYISLYDEEALPYDIAYEPQFAECPPTFAEVRLRSDDKSFDRAMTCTICPLTNIDALIAVLSLFVSGLKKYKRDTTKIENDKEERSWEDQKP